MTRGTRLPHAFGRYVLRDKVAAGGMAEVFRATQPGFGGFEKVVAIKRMYAQYADDEKFVEMLTDEAKIVSQLAHPNVVQILDVGRVQGDYYIAFEFVDGVDLFRLLQKQFEKHSDLPVDMAIHIVAELCSALDHAHARRTADGHPMHIIHRDVSPQNVLLSFLGEVKLTDFGIAKAAYRFTHTQAGVVKGKLYYMSPEQARGEPLDHRSDLFSAGILLYELLCTRPLYDEEDQGRLMSAVGRAEFRWPDDKRARIPAPLIAVAERALHRRADHRYQTGRAFREALIGVADQLDMRCDRERLGAFLRDLYAVADDRPPHVKAAFEVREPAVETTHWASSVGRVPVAPAPQPAPQPRAPAPIADDDLDALGGPTPTVMAAPAATVAAAAVPAGLDALLMPTTKPMSKKMAAEAGLGEDLPPPIPRQVATDPGSVKLGSAATRLPRPPALANPEAAPAPPPAPGDKDEATAMLDMAEMRRRLGVEEPPPVPVPAAAVSAAPPPPPPRPTPQQHAPPPAPPVASAAQAALASAPTLAPPSADVASAPTLPAPSAAPAAVRDPQEEKTRAMDVVQISPPPVKVSPPAPASAAPESEARTRFVPAMHSDGDLPAPPLSAAGGAPQATPSHLAAAGQARPSPAQAWVDPDDEPASWPLLGLTAAVWASVLMMGVYATLLIVNR